MVKPVKKKKKKVYLIVLSYCQLGLVQLFRILKKYAYKTSYKTCSQPLLLHLPINTHSLNSLPG